MAKILIVEDDHFLCDLVKDNLSSLNHTVDIAHNGRAGLDMLSIAVYDVILLDWEMPEMTGVELLKQFRSRGGKTPVIMLTKKGSINEKEVGFDSGTDDYLTKPFEMRELQARLRALLRRPANIVSNVLSAGCLSLDTDKHEVTKDGQPVSLLPKEFALLEFFMRHPNQTFSSDAILSRVWSTDTDASEEAVTTCIRRLRKKIDTADKPSMISTVYGVGYKLQV